MTPELLMEALGARRDDLSPLQRALLDHMAGSSAEADAGEAIGADLPPPEGDASPDIDRIDARADLIARFAAAIGACACCFGTDGGCPACAGRGAPGARAPDPDGFAFFIAPVLARRGRRTAMPGGLRRPDHPRRVRWDGAILLEGDET
ncbi:hypothetical protein JQC91_16970 [Jannaschia sp. Os4]|uniref:hypothetical protein n=1 Tax=Jannaschia sp. Os4 TaxID=2807617 RepID=UPI00193ADEDB|nr:hypothetical protein [Jannaschia sp. Os4]MBM2578000.1 hypothetical protein [Jannaschia sp. Os4]